jgi:phenylacetate-CoA ligase
VVERGEGDISHEEIREAIRAALLVTTEVRMVPPRTLPRSEYKSKLVDFSEAEGG